MELATLSGTRGANLHPTVIVLSVLALMGIGYGSLSNASLAPIALALALFALTSINYFVARSVVYPPFLYCGVWLIATIAYLFYPREIDLLTWESVFIFAGAAVCFSVGALVGKRRLAKGGRASFDLPTNNSQPRRLLLLYSIVTVPFFLSDTVRISGMPFTLTPEWLIATRAAIINSFLAGVAPYSSKFVSMAPNIAVLTAWLLILEERRRSIVILGCIVAILLSVLTTGRLVLLQFICGWMVLAVLKRKDQSITAFGKILMLSGAGALLIITALSLVTKSETQGDDAVSVALEMTMAYAAGPLAAFDYVVDHPREFAGHSSTVFADILAPAAEIGLTRYDPPPLIDSFSYIPFPMNVYTMLKPYYLDFGVVGCLLALLVIGMIHGFTFAAANHGNRLAALFLAYLAYAVIFSPFGDSYHLLQRHIYVIGYGMMYFFVARNLPVFVIGNRSRT